MSVVVLRETVVFDLIFKPEQKVHIALFTHC